MDFIASATGFSTNRTASGKREISSQPLQSCIRGAFSYLGVFMEEIAIAVAMVVVAILNWWADEH